MELNQHDWGKTVKQFLGNEHPIIVNETEELPEYLDLRDKLVQMPLYEIAKEDIGAMDIDEYMYFEENAKLAWVKITTVIIVCRQIEFYKGRKLIRLKMIVKVNPIKRENLTLDEKLLSQAVDLTCRPFHTTIELYAFQLPKHHYYKHMYHIKWGHKRKLNSERVDEGKVNDWEEIEKKNLVRFRKDKSLILYPHILSYWNENDLVLLHQIVNDGYGTNILGFNKGIYYTQVIYDGFGDVREGEISENEATAYPFLCENYQISSLKFTWCPLQIYLKMFHDRKAGLDKYFLGK